MTGNACGLFGQTRKILVHRARAGTATILRMECAGDIPHRHCPLIEKIQQALLNGGVRFAEKDDAGARVQFTTSAALICLKTHLCRRGAEKQPFNPKIEALLPSLGMPGRHGIILP